MDYSSKVLKEEKIKKDEDKEFEFSLITDTYTMFSVNLDIPSSQVANGNLEKINTI